MSKDFLEKRVGSKAIDLACKQHKQLSYFTTSKIQPDITQSYLEAWSEKQYSTANDYFLNWVKTVFKQDNFLSFFKYFREPNAASNLINGRIKEPLKRVFYAEDSYFKYIINNETIEDPEELADGFEDRLLDAVLFRHNDIIIHDLEDVNKPVRDILEIERVKAIDSTNGKIHRIGYSASIHFEDEIEPTQGYIYLDAEKFAFYDNDYIELINEPHDLGYCPAFYLIDECFGDLDPVRASMFSYLRADLEEYVFLKTLQRMTEPNGAIPVIAKLKTQERKKEGRESGNVPNHPMSAGAIAGKQSNNVRSDVNASQSLMQAGTEIAIPLRAKTDGSIDTDLVQNFIKFHYTPVLPLEYLDKRIRSIEQGIIVSVLGDYSEANEDPKNELQVAKSYVSKEDKLRSLSLILSKARGNSDKTMLALAHGPQNVQADCFYGSDFFQETQEKIYQLIKDSPNAIERKNLLTRLAQTQNRFNRPKARRQAVLYKLLPYASDADFGKAMDFQMIDPTTFELQMRFDHWITRFEAKYGDIMAFWEGLDDAPESNRLTIIGKLLTDLIEANTDHKKVDNTNPKNEKDGKNSKGRKPNSAPAGV